MSAPLVAVAPGIWTIHHPEFAVGGLGIGTRTNVFALADGSLALHAPGPLQADQIAAIRGLGQVSTIVIPNRMHHLFCVAAAGAFPDARVIAVAGIAEKEPTLRVAETLGEQVPDSLAGVVEMIKLEGCPKLEEHVLFFPASRTVLAVDLAFNLHGMTGFNRFAMWLNGANDRFCMTRIGKSQYIQDARAAGRSVTRMVEAWDAEAVVVSHGDVLAAGGREAIREAWAFANG
ncbi:hypothetical protein LBMAG42_22190 [Deltaproteobacteria bacterium]|nr:hypothetical protein LBMAG42_22190 [Deltaproteobacteria bacterium]